MAAMIKIDNLVDEKSGAHWVEAFEGRSYLDMKVRFAPAGGSFDVWLETEHPDADEEELSMMAFAFVGEMVRMLQAELEERS